MKIRCRLQEIVGPPELDWHIIVGRAGGVRRPPLLPREPGLFVKDPPALGSVTGQREPVAVGHSVLAVVGAGPGGLLDGGEPLAVGLDGAVLGVSVLAYAVPSGVILEVVGLVGTWAGGVVLHVVLLDHIDCFAMKRVLLGHAGFYLVLVLSG